MKYEYKFKIGMKQINPKCKISNYGFLSFMEELATWYSDTVGYGIKDIKNKNRAWIIMDWQLEVKERPSYSDEIFVRTYAVEMDKPSFHCYRNFEVYDMNNNLIAKATSKWIFFDTEKRRITKLDLDFMELYKTEISEYNPESKIEKLREPTSYDSEKEYTIKRFDIDGVGHLHNTNYLNIAYEAVPEQIYIGEEPKNLRIMYKHEVKLGDTVKCLYSKQDDGHYVVIKNQDKSKLHAIIKLW